MKIAVIGTGYVGLVVGAGLAETGNDVICVDIDEERVNQLKQGKIPIFEPGLEPLVRNSIAAERLKFTTDTVAAVKASLIVFLAVPTPMGEDGSADLHHVVAAAKTIALGINGYKIIVNKSTVPVGTAAKVKEVISEITSHPFDVVSNPEFLKEGDAVNDFMKPDRVVIGCDSSQAEAVISDLYSPFQRTGNRIVSMGIESAELTKYAANAFLATKISFMNEIARLCELVGADVNEVRAGISTDSRIGSHFLFPGVGYGGSCFPKDTNALFHIAASKGLTLEIVKAAIEANEKQKLFIPGKIAAHFGENLKGLRFAIWGLAFKAKTDDIRESPALTLVEYLLDHDAEVCAFDPEAMPSTKLRYNDIPKYRDKITYSDNSYNTVKDANALVIATEWNEFRRPDFKRIFDLMQENPVIFDGRNLFSPSQMAQYENEYKLRYFAVGQKMIKRQS